MDDFENMSEKIIQQRDNVLVDDEGRDGELLEILLNTREQGQMMEQLIKNQIEVKDAMINKLHKELDYYKQDAADRFVEQLMKAVIKVRRDMTRLVDSGKWDDLTADELRREYLYCVDDITDLLEQQNVDPYRSVPGEFFDPSIHQAKVEATEDATLDKTIKESISEGYKKGDKVLIPERVIVYQYKA